MQRERIWSGLSDQTGRHSVPRATKHLTETPRPGKMADLERRFEIVSPCWLSPSWPASRTRYRRRDPCDARGRPRRHRSIPTSRTAAGGRIDAMQRCVAEEHRRRCAAQVLDEHAAGGGLGLRQNHQPRKEDAVELAALEPAAGLGPQQGPRGKMPNLNGGSKSSGFPS